MSVEKFTVEVEPGKEVKVELTEDLIAEMKKMGLDAKTEVSNAILKSLKEE